MAALTPQNFTKDFEDGMKFIDRKDYVKAAESLKKAAEHGHVEAQFYLANMYADGQGVKKDYQQAMHWYRKVADQGFAEAQFNLGVMYYKGQGVTQDYEQEIGRAHV